MFFSSIGWFLGVETTGHSNCFLAAKSHLIATVITRSLLTGAPYSAELNTLCVTWYPADLSLSSTLVCAQTLSAFDTLSVSRISNTPVTCSNMMTGTSASMYTSIWSMYIIPSLDDLPLLAPALEYATQGAPETTMYIPLSIIDVTVACSYIASNPLRVLNVARALISISDPPTTKTLRLPGVVPALLTACPKLSTPANDAKTGIVASFVLCSVILFNLAFTCCVPMLSESLHFLIPIVSFSCCGNCCNHFLTSCDMGLLNEFLSSTTIMESRTFLYVVVPSAAVVCFQPVSIISNPLIVPFLRSMSDCLMSPVATNLAHVSVLLIIHSNNGKYIFCASSPNSHVRGRILFPRSRSKGKGLTFSLSESSSFNRLKASFTGLVQNPNFCSTDPGSKPIPAPPALSLTNGPVCMISSSNPSLSAKNPHNIAVNVFPDPAAP